MRLFVGLIFALVVQAGDPVSLPFKVTDYRIREPQKVLLQTNQLVELLIDVSFEVWTKGGSGALMEASGKIATEDHRYLEIVLPRTLEKGKDYEIRLRNGIQPRVKIAGGDEQAGPFKMEVLAISTKPSAVIEPSYVSEHAAKEFIVKSKVALQATPGGPKFAVIDYKGNAKSYPVEVKLLGSSPSSLGWTKLELVNGSLSQSEARLAVTGLTNVFADPVETSTAIVKLGALAKDKSEAQVFLKFLHQAGSGFPAWIVDAKLAPLLGQSFWSGWRARPSFEIDVGIRTVGKNKTNDLIKPSFGLTRFFRPNRIVEGIRLTPAVAYETNRSGTYGNLLGDVDAQFMIRGLYHPMQNRRRAKWIKEMEAAKEAKEADAGVITDIKLEEVDVLWGAGMQFFVGSELGGSLIERTVRAGKGTAGQPNYQVDVPSFLVARLKPKVRAFVELWRLTWDGTFTSRILMSREYYTFESPDARQVVLGDLKGFRPYIETSFSVRLDRSGHVSLSTTYKRGAVPPAYQNANTFLTGLEVKY